MSFIDEIEYRENLLSNEIFIKDASKLEKVDLLSVILNKEEIDDNYVFKIKDYDSPLILQIDTFDYEGD